MLLQVVAASCLSVAPVEPPETAVWVQPLSFAATVGIAIPTHHAYVAVPIGANFQLGATSIVAEVTPLFAALNVLLGLSMGPLVHLSGDTVLSGFFLAPKVRFEGGMREGLPSYIFEVALDVGYQLRRGAWYVAFIVGGGAGFGRTNQLFDGMLGLLLPTGGAFAPTPRLVITVNMNVLRVGYAF